MVQARGMVKNNNRLRAWLARRTVVWIRLQTYLLLFYTNTLFPRCIQEATENKKNKTKNKETTKRCHCQLVKGQGSARRSMPKTGIACIADDAESSREFRATETCRLARVTIWKSIINNFATSIHRRHRSFSTGHSNATHHLRDRIMSTCISPANRDHEQQIAWRLGRHSKSCSSSAM